MAIVAEAPIAPFRVEDLLKPGMPEKFVEVIEGELVVMTPAGWKHNKVAAKFLILFDLHCSTRPHLDYGGDNDGFLLRRDPDVLLSPDASLFKRRERPDRPWMEFTPEIAVEVISPANSPSEIAYKRRKYFEFGAEQVWLVRPEEMSLEFEFRDGRRIIHQGAEFARGEGLADGLLIDLAKLFEK